MHFEIQLRAENSFNDVAKKPQREAGLNLLDVARKETGVNLLHPNKVSGFINSIRLNMVSIELSENQARELSLIFEDQNQFVMIVKDKFLNDCVEIKSEIKADEETGEILSVKFFYELNKKKANKKTFEEAKKRHDQNKSQPDV